MKETVTYIIFSLIIFVSGYAIGRREGIKEGYFQAQASFGIIMRKKILDSLDKTIDESNIKAE